jgi:dTDP-4-amino-4,6-dideoxygalactose transaminase
MVPRAKANYNLCQLAKALFIREGGRDYRGILISQLRDFLGEHNILLTPSGRSALYFILKAIDKPRVVVPAYTCNAVIEAAVLAKKEVVYVEVEDNGFNLSLSELENLADEHTIVIATHQFGFPCEIEDIVSVCRRKRAVVIEDAAASLGSRVNGKPVGTFADAAFFSFDSTKLINVPLKGGFLVGRNADLFEKICTAYKKEIELMPLWLKWKLILQACILVCLQNHFLYRAFHWMRFELAGKYTAETANVSAKKTVFYRYDMANWQAYIATRQVKVIDQLINTRRRRYAQFIERLSLCTAFELPAFDEKAEWACVRFPIRVRSNKFLFYDKIAGQGVDCAFSFTFITCPDKFKNAKRLGSQILDLPFYYKLTDKEFEKVVSALIAADREGASE